MSFIHYRRKVCKDCCVCKKSFSSLKSSTMLRMEMFMNFTNWDWTTYAILGFTAIFLVVGIARVVEIHVFRFSKLKLYTFILLHVLGVLLFAAALGLMAIDTKNIYRTIMSFLFFSGVLILFPMHIYLGLLRRVLGGNSARK